MINAFANYFKHHDGWQPNWDDATGKSANTVPIIRSVAASEAASDNCRRGLAALGIDRVANIADMAQILTLWHGKMYAAYRNELKAFGS